MKHSAATQATLDEMEVTIAHYRRNPDLYRNAAMSAAIQYTIEQEEKAATDFLNAWDEDRAFRDYVAANERDLVEQPEHIDDHGDLTIDEYLAGGRSAYEAQQNDDYSFFR
ncbi:hypothetical protein KYT24_004389 [Salmonella enterica]|nr:hypothetical protein [Salmonella enterica]